MMRRDGLMDLAEVSAAELQANAAAIAEGRQHTIDRIGSVAWFLPEVPHALVGGLRTVFASAEHLSLTHGTRHMFVIFSYGAEPFDTAPLEASLRAHFPGLEFVLRTLRRGLDRAEDLPAAQIAVCTLWTTAYVMLRYNQTRRKFYLMQDYEPAFYPAGGLSLMIEQTYRLGYSCIANTPGVGAQYLRYSPDMVSFLPGVDRAVFHPPESPAPRDTFKLVFYGRPQRARNAFFLGADILKSLKQRLNHRLQIVSAGADWAPADYGLEGVVENLGLLKSIRAVADLYRSADMGLVLMGTPHPSYQPLEYMACGCLVATNLNEANGWLLNHDNALLLEPLPEIAAKRITELLDDPARRAHLVENGLKTVAGLSWDKAFAAIEARMLGNGPRGGA